MYAHELYEQNKPRVVVTYPGRFQPFHQGHAGVFAQLQKKFGADNVYILTSNDTSSAKSPFNFTDKYQLITAAGVPGDKIIETNQMYILPDNIDPASTIFVTAVGSPDKDRLNPDSFLKKDKKDKEGNIIKPAGSPSYYRTWGSDENPVTADQHGYVIVIPEIKKSISIKGQQHDVSHGTEARNLWNAVRNDAEARKEFLTQMYQRPSAELGQIFDKIPATANEDVEADSQTSTSPIHGVVEAINPDITNPEFSHQQQIGDYLYVARDWSKGLKITAYHGAKKIGYAELMYQTAPFDDFAHPKTTPKRVWLESEWTEVDPKYQRQGIMRTMYAYAKMLGNSVKPSELRSPDAKAAWSSWRQAGDAKHLTSEGNDPWGPQGNFAGDKHVDVGGVTMKIIQVGDMVKYLGQKAEVVALSKDRKRARIAIQKGMGGITKDVNTSDLKQLGQGVAEGSINDYFKRRKDEEDRIAGIKAPAKRTPRQTDYEKKRKEQGVAEGAQPQFVVARYIDEFADGEHWYVKGTTQVIQRFVQLANSLEDESVKGTEYEPGKGMMANIHSKLGNDNIPQWQIVQAQNLEAIKPIGSRVLQLLMQPDLTYGVQEFMSEFLWTLEEKGLALVTTEPEQGVAEGNKQSSAKTGIYQSEVYGTKAYHSKCLEKGCDWESRRFDRIKQAQDAAKKHAQKHFKSDVTEDAASDLQEIQRTKGDEEGLSTKGQNWGKETLSKIKMLPGSQRFGYTAGRAASFLTGADTIIELFDVKHPQDGLRKAGFLSLRSAPWFPIKNSYQVANVGLDSEYRGQGLGQNLYGIAMKLLGMTIVADDTQTPQARSSWLRLSQVPGVAINGYTSVFPDEWALRNNRNEIYDDSAKRLISSLLKAGGQEIGKNPDFVYVSFPVGANADQNELQALQKGMSIYSSRHPEDGGTQNGLYARWGGQVREQDVAEDAAGVGVVAKNKKMAKDPRYNMSITKDVKPSTPKNMLRAFRLSEEDTNISEEEIMAMVKKFLPLAMQELEIKKLPRIILKKHVEAHDGQATFGRFVNTDEKIYIGIADRHPVDVLRTLAHELVHFKQYEDGKMYDGAGQTGSPIENEAHVKAGVIMRHFNKKYPESIKAQSVEINENRDQTIEEKYAFILNEDLDELEENFADGRNPQDKGDSKRYNVPTKGKVSSLRKIAKQGGRRGQLAHWMANMKSGKAKKK